MLTYKPKYSVRDTIKERRPLLIFFCLKTPFSHFHELHKSLTCTSAVISIKIVHLISPLFSRVVNDIEIRKSST